MSLTRAAQTFVLLLAPALSSAPSLRAAQDPGRQAFLDWARQALHPLASDERADSGEDLAALGRMIGDASVVALSEAVHAAAEPLEFRNRVFRYLVEHHGFTAIAIESGIAEGRIVHDYVRSGAGDLPDVMARGIGWGFDRLPQNQDLVRWMRSYNADPAHQRKLNFYGFDVPGSPGNPRANRGPSAALEDVLSYVARVDSGAAIRWRERAARYLPHLHVDGLVAGDREIPARPQYPELAQSERDALTAAISDLVQLLERNEARYTGASSAGDFEWAHRAAIGARQIDAWLRLVPVGWQPSVGLGFLREATDLRDRAQADNLAWITEREVPAGRVLVFASRYHVSTAPIRIGLWGDEWNAVMGTYLRPRLGNRLVTIGNLVSEGDYGCGGGRTRLASATPSSIDGLARELGVPRFLLDLRRAPPRVARWLDDERRLGEGQLAWDVSLGRAFDILFYVDSVTPACPSQTTPPP